MSKPELESRRVFYPESDGKPMAETDVHRDLLFDLVAALGWRFRHDPAFYVSGNLLLYYEEGRPEKAVAPDVFVVRGIPSRRRRIYKVWVEGKGPDLVVELTSRSTHAEDLGGKRLIYERLGVREYFIFDPEGVRFDPRLRGFRLVGGSLCPATPTRIEGAKLIFHSEVVGLELHGSDEELRWVDPADGSALRIPEEAYAICEEAQAEIDSLRKEVTRLRADPRR
jgi:Uma2 family endonuclease